MLRSILLLLLTSIFALPGICASTSCDPESSRSALVIIDMQPYFRTRTGEHQTAENIRKFEQAIEVQRASIRAAKAANIPIIMVKYEIPEATLPKQVLTKEGRVRVVNTTSDFYDISPALKNETAGYKNLHILEKDTDGIFDKTQKYQNKSLDELRKILRENDIGTLIIAGANGGACVKASIEGALHNTNRCRVIALSDGIADFNFPEFIYPYKGHYKEIGGTNCPSCRFEEVQSVNDARAYMVGPAPSQKSVPSGAAR